MSKDYTLYLNGIGANSEERNIIADYVSELFEIAMMTLNYKINKKEKND